jgi:drug/metabolite transporter (DMT)-like permease
MLALELAVVAQTPLETEVTGIITPMPEKLKYSLIMFLAGTCYGVIVPLVSISHAQGYSTLEIMTTQYLMAASALVVICLLFSRRRIPLRDVFKLLGMGVTAASTSFCYYTSLDLLPPATSLTLLFQFVWMGMLVQAVLTRTLPRPATVFTVLLVVAGAVLATGMLEDGAGWESFDAAGVVFGLLSAVSYTAFLALSSRVAIDQPPVNRTMFTAVGSFLIAFTVAPTYFSHPVVLIDPVLSASLGLVGICLPVLLIAISAPKLPTGLTTVMASSELPSGVICAALFLGEPISLTVGAGVVIVLAGIVLSELESLRNTFRKPATPPFLRG